MNITATQHLDSSLRNPAVLESFVRRFIDRTSGSLELMFSGTIDRDRASSLLDGAVNHFAGVMCGESVQSGFLFDEHFHLREWPPVLGEFLEAPSDAPVLVLYRALFRRVVMALYELIEAGGTDEEFEAGVGGLVVSTCQLLGVDVMTSETLN